MNKIQLADQLVKNVNITKVDALKFLDALMEAITRELENDGRVTLAGFGTFKTVFKQRKKGRNPRTGEMITIPKRKVVKFVPGKGLKAFTRGPHGPGAGPDETFITRGGQEEAEEIGIHGPGPGPDEDII